MATHKFNTGTPWKSMQFTHPHVSKYFLYGHNKGYQHVSTTTSPPCQAMLNHPKSPIDQYIHHQIFFIQSFIHVIPTMNWSLAPLYPRSQPPTVQQHPLGPPNTSSVAWRFGCGCWDWWPNAWLVGWEDGETPFLGGSKSRGLIENPTKPIHGSNITFITSGWWLKDHLEKWWSSSMGRMTSHIWNGKMRILWY